MMNIKYIFIKRVSPDMKSDKPQDQTKFWILPHLGNLELLHASYKTHSFSKHTHEGYAIGIIEKGALRFSYRGENLVAPPGHINLVVPGEAHDGHAASDMGWTYRMFYLEPGLLKKAASEIAGRRKGLPFFKAGVIKDHYLACLISHLHLMLETPGIPLMEQESQLLTMLANFILRHADELLALKNPGKENRAVNQARDYIETNYAEDISIDKLSKICSLSPFHLIRVFNKEMGIPPHAYLTQIRIKRAKELLARSYSAAYTACETGFVDQSHLTRQFKLIMGVTPGKYSNIIQYRSTLKD